MNLLADENVTTGRSSPGSGRRGTAYCTLPRLPRACPMTRRWQGPDAELPAVLITADKDFGELVYRLGRIHAGVVLIRLAGLSPEIEGGDCLRGGARRRRRDGRQLQRAHVRKSVRIRRRL